MPRIIALMNQKGGVGKTTTTVNLGAALAEAGKRVCLIDLDPQAHLTINYGVEPSADITSLYDVLCDDASFLSAIHKVDQNVALVPSSIDLAAAEIELVSVLGRETILKERMEAAQHDFDYILLDCPPSLGLLTINALGVAGEVIIPMQPHFLALQGFAKLLETVQLVNRRMNPALRVSGVVLTMFDAQTKLTSEVVAELDGFIASAKGTKLPWAEARIFQTKIRRNIKLAESPSFGQTIIKYGPTSNGAADYRALAGEVISMSEPNHQPQRQETRQSTTTAPPPAPDSAPAPTPASIPAPGSAPAPTAAPIPAPAAKAPPAPPTKAPATKAPPAPPTHAPPAEPSVEVVLNTAIDQSKLTASRVHEPAPDGAPGDAAADAHDAEVAA